MDFAKRIGAARRESIFNPDPQHIYVWCGTCVHAATGDTICTIRSGRVSWALAAGSYIRR